MKPTLLQFRNFVLGLFVWLLLIFNINNADAQLGSGITPLLVEQLIFPGKAIIINNSVHTPEMSPKAEIVFLADTTGSMSGAIGDVRQEAQTILDQVLASQPEARFAIAEYKDYSSSAPYPFQINQTLTDDKAKIETAIGLWTASGSDDEPEAQLNALTKIAAGAINFSDNAARIIVWFGDAPGHNPSNGATLSSTIVDLQALGIKVIAVEVHTKGSGIDETGQATAITNATGGIVEAAGDSTNVSEAILSGLQSLLVNVSMSSNCPSPIAISFNPPLYDEIMIGDAVNFVETISISALAPGGTYNCYHSILVDGNPMNGGGTERIIHVPDLKASPQSNKMFNFSGSTHKVVATIEAGSYGPVSNTRVEFEILSGPNAGQTISGVTDTNGQLSFEYTAIENGTGTDIIEVRFTNDDGTVTYGTVTVQQKWFKPSSAPF